MTGMSILILKKDFNYMSSMKKQNNGRRTNASMKKAILFFGGTVKLSEQLKTHNANVSKWLYGRRRIPLRHAIKIEQLTKGEIKAKELRPDIFED